MLSRVLMDPHTQGEPRPHLLNGSRQTGDSKARRGGKSREETESICCLSHSRHYGFLILQDAQV